MPIRGYQHLIGRRSHASHQTEDERLSPEIGKRLRCAHAPRFPTGLDSHRHAGTDKILLQEVADPSDEPLELRSLGGRQFEDRHAAALGKRTHRRDIGQHRNGLRRSVLRPPIAGSPEFRGIESEFQQGGCSLDVAAIPLPHDLYAGQAACPVAFDHHDVVTRHGSQNLVAFHLVRHGLDTGQCIGRGDDRLGGARLAMTVGILAGHINGKPRMTMVLDAADIQAAGGELGDDLAHDGSLAGIVPPDKSRRRDSASSSRISLPFLRAAPYWEAATNDGTLWPIGLLPLPLYSILRGR